MAQNQLSKSATERRCPNCGTRVARDAESCFMCGYDLRLEARRKRSISWLDALLVLAVLFVLVFWWQAGSRQTTEEATPTVAAGIPNEEIPFLPPTPTNTPDVGVPTETPIGNTAPTGTVEHTVVAGETLLSIALDFNTSVEAIQRANGLTGVLIRIGDKLVIPGQQAVSAPPSATVVAEAATSNFQYTVKDGDTIISIAVALGSTVDDILRANGMSENDIIRAGDVLNVPVRAVPQAVLDSAQPAETPSAPADPAATPTPQTSAVYARPQLIAPADNTTLPRNEPALLRWTSVDLLAPNEWYVVLLYPQSPDAKQFASIWTKATSHRIELEDAPAEGQSATYSWQVSVVRVRDAAGGQSLEPASPASELRRFTWQ